MFAADQHHKYDDPQPPTPIRAQTQLQLQVLLLFLLLLWLPHYECSRVLGSCAPACLGISCWGFVGQFGVC